MSDEPMTGKPDRKPLSMRVAKWGLGVGVVLALGGGFLVGAAYAVASKHSTTLEQVLRLAFFGSWLICIAGVALAVSFVGLLRWIWIRRH